MTERIHISTLHVNITQTGDPQEQAERIGEAVHREMLRALDPYNGNDIAADAIASERMRCIDVYITPPGQKNSNRDRLIAALASELRRPVVARYPSEARSDRVFEGQNPRFK